MIWIFCVITVFAVLFFLAAPMFRAGKTVSNAAVDETDYLAEQLKDIDQARALGDLTDALAEEAGQETRRRLLAEYRRSQSKQSKPISSTSKQAIMMLVAAAPIAALALYASIGNPGMNDTQRGQEIARASAVQLGAIQANADEGQSSLLSGGDGAPSLSQSIEKLKQKLANNPDDRDGWIMLAESHAQLNQFSDAAEAFSRAAELAPDLAYLHAAAAESLAMAAGGVITDEADAALDRALAIDADEPRARFYKALGLEQSGDKDAALAALKSLAENAPEGAPWVMIVRGEINRMSGVEQPSSPQTVASNVSAPVISIIAPEVLENEIFVGDPPYTVWMDLIRAYAAQGNDKKTIDTIVRAKKRYANAPFVLREIEALEAQINSGALITPPVARNDPQPQPHAQRKGPTQEQMAAAADLSDEERTAMIEGMVGGLAARLEENPDDLEGWIMLGRSYRVIGDTQKSISAFSKAAEMAPQDVETQIAYAQARLASLDQSKSLIDDETHKVLTKINSLDGNQPFALFFLGVTAQQRGNKSAARQYWEKALAVLPPEGPEAAQVKSLMSEL